MPSDLPIITPDPTPSRTEAEKYGGLYHLGIGGLIVLAVMLAWFGVGLRAHWGALRNIYILHDGDRSEVDRVRAAVLARDPTVSQRQYWDVALRTGVPPLARYLVAECLTPEAVADDPRGYVLAAVRSTSWPDWFRWLIVRPLAYAADDGMSLPLDDLSKLLRSPDPFLRLWVAYTLAVGDEGGRSELAKQGKAVLLEARDRPGAEGELAGILFATIAAQAPRRDAMLDRASRWMRSNHPDSARVWRGWRVDGEMVVPLHPAT